MADKKFTVYYLGHRRSSNDGDMIEELDKVGAELVPLPLLDDEDEIIRQTPGADALIVVESPITRRVLAALSQCKAVLRTGVGFDCIDVAAATEHGVAVINVPDLWTREVANHAVSLLLACNRGIVGLALDVRRGRWGSSTSRPVGGIHAETVGVVGLGQIGSAFARRMRAFEVELIAFDPYIPDSAFEAVGASSVSFDDLLGRSDYVSVHMPLSEETYHLFDESALRKMRRTAYLINTSRGPVVDEAALIKALREGWLQGAGLDVLEKEPPDPDNPLLQMDNVVITPHTAHYSDASLRVRPRRYGAEIAAVLDHRKPMHLVNPKVLEVLPLR